jgi:hypothetical protein
VKEDDFLLFDNILRIDASENQLPFRMSIQNENNSIIRISFL